MEFAAPLQPCSSVEIAVGTSIDVDFIKELYHTVIIILLMKVTFFEKLFLALSNYIKNEIL